jgi:hypothetical protein
MLAAASERAFTRKSAGRTLPGDLSDAPVGRRNQVPVTFWAQSGKCYGGLAPATPRNVIFIESQDLLPVGAEVTVHLLFPWDGFAEGAVIEGIVVWQCPREDHFKNLKGFGLRVADGRLPAG